LPPITTRSAKLVIAIATLLRVNDVVSAGRNPESIVHWIDCAGGDCPAASPNVNALNEYIAPQNVVPPAVNVVGTPRAK
jgi:hypothetical protein